jgi:hypothetical protein
MSQNKFHTHTELSKLINFMKISLSWKAARSLPTQEFSNILWKPNVHELLHKSSQLVPILSQDPVYIYPVYLSKIHFSIILPSTFMSS